jgi:hypothetical protein
VEKIDLPTNEIRQMFKDGFSTAEMARKLFTSEATVSRRLKEMGLKRVVVYDKGMYLRMKGLGITDADAAYVFGGSPRDLYRWKSRVGLARKQKVRRKAE